MKVGDLVRWKGRDKLLGIVLKTKSADGPCRAIAVLAHIPERHGPEWFLLSELELINESR